MKKYDKLFSVIIPHRNSLDTLERLFESIPNSTDVEIILVDNSPIKVSLDQIPTNRSFTLHYSDPVRGAGGARNEGIKHASGKWLLFADADDFYSEDAFDIYYQHVNSESDIIYTGMGGISDDTGLPSNRGDGYVKLIKDYLKGAISETYLRLHFHSPCCKMVSNEMVQKNDIRYSEVIAGNDAYFSMLSGYYARSITVVDRVTYIATVRSGSLTQRKDYKVFLSRYCEDLKINKFLREHNLSEQQYHIFGTLVRSKQYGIKAMYECFRLALKNKQNIFIGLIK